MSWAESAASIKIQQGSADLDGMSDQTVPPDGAEARPDLEAELQNLARLEVQTARAREELAEEEAWRAGGCVGPNPRLERFRREDPAGYARMRAEAEARAGPQPSAGNPTPGGTAKPPPAPEPERGSLFGGLVVLGVIGLVIYVLLSADSSSDVTVTDHSCTRNPDGSVHVQGELRNDGGGDEITIVEFNLTLAGGETETSQPFGGYSVPGNQTSLVGEDLNVPPGATWVDCGVEIKN